MTGKAGHAILKGFPATGNIRCDDGTGRGSSLQKRVGHALVVGGKDDAVGLLQQRADVADLAVVVDGAGPYGLLHKGTIALLTRTAHMEFCVRVDAAEAFGGLQVFADALGGCHPSHEQESDGVLGWVGKRGKTGEIDT